MVHLTYLARCLDMTKDERIALISMPIVVLLGVGFAAVGSVGDDRVLGLPVYGFAVGLAFIIQWIVFIPAYLGQTEKYYDLTGGATYLTVTIAAVCFSPVIDARAILLATLTSIWAIRLASFLFRRIHKAGKDDRFDNIKTSFLRFLLAWTLQGLWVTFTIAAALAAITTPFKEELGWFTLAGLIIWCIGFGIEAVADAQKSAFKANPGNKGKFIQSGLWAKSRHPNYFGEIVLWIGVAIIAFPVLQGWQYATLISPVFVTLLLTRISGVPMLETKADNTWGGQEDYETYKKNTPVLIPKL
jgi:steroid 5-alpha reductase family enzyme